MRYYEIVLMIHPDYSEKISDIIKHYTDIVVNDLGKVGRTENWGCRQLAYPIKRLHKAYYVLLNIESSQKTCINLNNSFRLNECIIRSMIMRIKGIITEPSPMILQKKEENKRENCNVNVLHENVNHC